MMTEVVILQTKLTNLSRLFRPKICVKGILLVLLLVAVRGSLQLLVRLGQVPNFHHNRHNRRIRLTLTHSLQSYYNCSHRSPSHYRMCDNLRSCQTSTSSEKILVTQLTVKIQSRQGRTNSGFALAFGSPLENSMSSVERITACTLQAWTNFVS